jgi:glycogen operon protein
LEDLVSYDHKHNEANGENNRDGADDNASWNSGVEGPTDDPKILELRRRKKRSMLATLLFSQGVPMLLAGDEMGHGQGGNNNAYCQDNEISWLNWSLDQDQQKLLDFTRRLLEIFRSQPVFHRRRFFHGQAIHDAPAIDWIDPAGQEMSAEDWNTHFVRSLGVRLRGDSIDVDDHGDEISGDTLVILFNADQVNDIPFTLPGAKEKEFQWELLVDTAEVEAEGTFFKPGEQYPLKSCTLAVFRAVLEEEAPKTMKPH